MKALGEYTWYDWCRLRPGTQWYKSRRYDTLRRRYERSPAQSGGIDLMRSVRGRRVLVTVAFDDPDATDLQAAAIATFVADTQHIIADISMREDAAARIAAIAERRRIPYVRLPRNPWPRPDQASRTHGLALNWVWCNVIRPGEPEVFGLLDDDIFPTAPDDPFAILERQPVYGCCRAVGGRWFLGVGFCMYRFDRVKDVPLDFSQDWFNGLDTGGANWNVLFRHLDRSTLQFVDTRFEPYRPGADLARAPIQWCGVWLHEVGSTRRDGFAELAADKRRVVKERVNSCLAAAENQSTLRPERSAAGRQER